VGPFKQKSLYWTHLIPYRAHIVLRAVNMILKASLLGHCPSANLQALQSVLGKQGSQALVFIQDLYDVIRKALLLFERVGYVK
jgi:hypothetical protein